MAFEIDLIVVVPATANIICKVASGIADDIISTTLSVCEQPLLFAPAMNNRMWSNQATQNAIDKLKKIFSTNNDIFIATCSGTGVMEASISNFLSAGDEIIVASVGWFGDRFSEIANAYNVKVRNLNKNEVRELEPNIAEVYYAGQIFTGSRYTTNPLAISNKIFDKFYRADSSNTAIQGTGLGMTIVKYILEAHCGKIWIETELSKGTTIYFTIPN